MCFWSAASGSSAHASIPLRSPLPYGLVRALVTRKTIQEGLLTMRIHPTSARLTWCVSLAYWHIYYSIVILPYCHTAILQSYNTAILPYHNIAILQYYQSNYRSRTVPSSPAPTRSLTGFVYSLCTCTCIMQQMHGHKKIKTKVK